MQTKPPITLELRARRSEMLDQTEAQRLHAELAAAEARLEQEVQRIRLRFGVSELGKFFGLTVLIFLVIFTALNYPAYKKQFDFWQSQNQAQSSDSELSPTKLRSSLVDNNLDAKSMESPALAEAAEQAAVTTHAAPSVDLDGVPVSVLPPVTSADPATASEPAADPSTSAVQSDFLQAHFAAPRSLFATDWLDLPITPPEDRISIPRLQISAPIREVTDLAIAGGDWEKIEQQIQSALRDGVVHVPGTARPGQFGNAFLTGHSSYYPWDDGRYKDVFALLPHVKVGDEIIAYQDQHKYTYHVTQIQEVKPSEISVLAPTNDYRMTLMTCVPLGTTLRRLVVTAQLDQ